MKIAVFSDVPLVLRAMEHCLSLLVLPAEIIGAGSVKALLETAGRSQPDVIVLDFITSLHFSVVRDLSRISPRSKIVIWTRDISIEAAYEAIQLGVRGIIPKTCGVEQFAADVLAVCSGQLCLDQGLSTALLTLKPTRLTPRETQLVELLAQGLKNKEIATALNISEGSVKIYLSRLFQKVGAKDRFELALFGLKLLGLGQAAGQTPSPPLRMNHRPPVLLARTVA